MSKNGMVSKLDQYVKTWDFGVLGPGIRNPPQSLKEGPPYLSLMNSFFSEYFIVFFTFVSFLYKI